MDQGVLVLTTVLIAFCGVRPNCASKALGSPEKQSGASESESAAKKENLVWSYLTERWEHMADSKPSSSSWTRLRATRLVTFLLEAYREIRYKVTWPTLQEAWNMTLVVLAFSAAVSAVLSVVDAGLLKLFQLIVGS
jgi:preprotein translocase SecE subunit